MSKLGQHSNLAPLLSEFVPKGRTAQDVCLYKIFRWWHRKNRQQLYESTMATMQEVMMYGSSVMKVTWSGDAHLNR
jgi:hypothetical protein